MRNACGVRFKNNGAARFANCRVSMEVAVVGYLVRAGAIGIDHPDLIRIADVSLISDAAVHSPSEAIHAVHPAGRNLHGGVGIARGTNPEVDVDVALDSYNRAGIGGHAE